jgi:cyclophilin family peptidyl-prolyl cis-trans isomerase
MSLPKTFLALALAAAGLCGQTPRPRVRLLTSYGPILLELEPEAAPRTVENFLAYVQEGYYTGTIFHRVIRGFMIQGGGLVADLTEKAPHAPIPNEAERASRAGLLNRIGTVAMARTEAPDSASSQFFINTAENTPLDFRDRSPQGNGYCVFGRVVEGMDVVGKIEKVITVTRRGLSNMPEYAVVLKGAELLPSAAPAP